MAIAYLPASMRSMPMRIISFFLLLLFSPLCFCQKQGEKPYVLLVSFDGFRHDYVQRYDLPNFKKFISQGAAAAGLIPSFPSKTFPNHYTIVTGLYPGNHGLVDNHFYDKQKKIFYTMRNQEVVKDSSFYGGVPIWQLAKQHGLISASYFWVGSELKDESLHPDYFFNYNHSVPFEDRIDQVINWLKLPKAERPRLITLYFSSPDSESHEYGPFAEETRKTVLRMDSLLGNMMNRIEATGLPVNILLVSDHGMVELTEKEETFVFLEELMPQGDTAYVVSNGGTQAHIYSQSQKKVNELYNQLKKNENGNYTVLKQGDFPKHWNYTHPRSGDILIVAAPGKYLVSGAKKKYLDKLRSGKKFGVHGFDPTGNADMQGIFYAKGPGIKPGSKLPAINNIHIYPLMAYLLGIRCPEVDGRLSATRPIIKR